MLETDLQLLARYTREHAEDAFAKIVRRHLDLVFSAALRQVRSPQLAEEVAQSVFTKLARQANGLAPDTILTAWLYKVTRCTAIDIVRREVRRQFREQLASELIAMNAISDDWTQIEPLLDDAMLALEDIDRTAVLLRFFENKSLREVGQALGTNEDAARKRVSRAVERLREFFVKQGASVSLGGIAVVISANAVQAAPAGLTVTISTVALTGTTAGAGTLTLLKTMAMTKLKVVVIGSLVAATVVLSVVTQHNANARIRTMSEAVLQQSKQIVQAETENQQLSNIIALAHDPSGNNQTGLRDLRDKAVALQKQTNDFAALQDQERRLQSSLAKAIEDLSGDTNSQSTVNSKTNELHARIFYAMDLASGAHGYAGNHDGQFPATCEEAAVYMSAEARKQTNFTPGQFEIVYHGTLEGIEQLAHPNRIILVKERQPKQNIDGKWVEAWADLRTVGRYYSPINGDFDSWRAQHVVS
ncbi:MAG: hypothetical protein JWM99_994, partial [Verrucomicrobiales bacterium]|nr:hypothetical protein [Verrucomicrobiales bacterium]